VVAGGLMRRDEGGSVIVRCSEVESDPHQANKVVAFAKVSIPGLPPAAPHVHQRLKPLSHWGLHQQGIFVRVSHQQGIVVRVRISRESW
jgi:hypothetical protein